jgi:hypothetical protein
MAQPEEPGRRRGNIRQRGSSLQVRFFAGKDPVTGRDVYLTASISGTDGVVALCEAGTDEIVDPGWSDRQGELVDGSQDPKVCFFFGPEFVVAAADVLDEGVPGADHPCAAETFEAAHRP